jgi:vacuolar-type H+-ATPase subunit E/Vma4
METDEVRVAVLEQKQIVVEQFVEKLDSAIEKIAEVNNKVSRMLAVHEEKISKQEQVDQILFTKIDELRNKMDRDHDLVVTRISILEKKLWIGLGILGTVVALSNPQAIRTLKPLLSSTESAIVAPMVAFVNESY